MIDKMAPKIINVWALPAPVPQYLIRCHHGHRLDEYTAPTYLPGMPGDPGHVDWRARGAICYRHATRLACLPANAHQGRCTDGVSVWYEFIGQCPDCGQLYRIVTTPTPR